MKWKPSPFLTFLFRIWIGLVFAYAGYLKLMEPVENFRGMLAEYQVLPYASLHIVAAVVPWMEFLSGIFMILGLAVPLASFVMAFLCLGFLIVIGSSNVLFDSASKECGCFGQSGPIHLTVWQTFILDLINLAVAGKIFLEKKTILSLDGLLGSLRPTRKDDTSSS